MMDRFRLSRFLALNESGYSYLRPAYHVFQVMKGVNTRTMFVLLVGISVILISMSLHKGHFWGGDFASYIMQAQSILEGTQREFIEANRFTIENSSFEMGPDAYPWGLPALLAAVIPVLGTHMVALKMVGCISFLLFLLCLWIGFRKRHTPLGFLGLTSIFVFNPYVLNRFNAIGTEFPFLYLSTQSIILITVLVVENRSITRFRSLDLVLLGASIAAAFFVRTNGLVLLATLAIAQCIALVQKQWKEETDWKSLASPMFLKTCITGGRYSLGTFTLFLTPYLTFFCAVVLWNFWLPKGGVSQMGILDQISFPGLIDNAIAYLKIPVDLYFGVPFRKVVYVLSLLIAMVGVAKRFKVDYPILVYGLLTYVLYIVWPPQLGLRGVMPIIPFYFSFFISGLEHFQGSAKLKNTFFRKVVFVVPLATIISFFLITSMPKLVDNLRKDRESTYGAYTESSKEMYGFIEENTEGDSTIIFFKPRVLRMITQRKSILINRTDQLSRGDYLCYCIREEPENQISESEIKALVENEAAQLLFENRNFRFYRLLIKKG